jgi:hypothetical protein
MMVGHHLGSFETRAILLEDVSERAVELGGHIMIAFVLDILQTSAYIADVIFEG